VGEDIDWERATESLKEALEISGLDYKVDPGEGVFYGPKIDIKIKDALDRSWQCTTIQFDFNLPERFDMTYIGEDNEAHRPYMIHRALLGSLERFYGVLIEHYMGNFPVWLAPVQVQVIPISEHQTEYAKDILQALRDADIRAEIDVQNEKIGYKIREAEKQKIPYMVIVGNKEVENQNISVRKHLTGDLGAMDLKDFVSTVTQEIQNKTISTIK
jgi:threonyl-tRNA synthetase